MGKSPFLLLAFAMVVLSVSCAPSVSRSGDYGRIAVAFGDASSRRGAEAGSMGLETGWPGGILPTFSSVSLTVSAPDMSTVTTTTSLSSGTLTVQVPAGVGRLVQLVAVPAANSTAPYFAKSYSGSASVDVGEGEIKSVTITLGLAETKIALCSPAEEMWNWRLAAASSLTETPATGTDVSLYFFSDIEYDEHGRLFVSSDNRGIQRFSSLTGEPEPVLNIEEPYIGGLAYQKSTGRLFFTRVPTEGPITLAYVDVASGVVHDIGLPAGDLQMTSAIAADDTGVYVVAYGAEQIFLLKLGASGTALASPPVSCSEIKLNPAIHCIYDMTARDGILYIAAGYNFWQLFAQTSGRDPTGMTALTEEPPISEPVGKVVALDASTLKYLWEVDWPTIDSLVSSGPSAEIYLGPLRFLGFTKNGFYLADAGLRLVDLGEGQTGPDAILGRAVEIDTGTHTMSATGFAGPVMPLEGILGGD